MKQYILKIKFSPAFTLIELIVVIVILAILATIAFLSFNNYNSWARDSTRLADVNSLNKWIELYQINSWYYPIPEWSISTWTIYWVDVVYKWIIWDSISSNLIKVSKTPKDPLSNSNYVYGISYDKKYFQVWIVLEASSNKSSFDNIITEAIAWSWAWNYFSKIKGNYMWVIKFSSWTTTKSYYLANIPSLLYNSWWVTDLLNTWTYYIANNNTNLAYQIDPNVTINNKTSDVIIKEVTNRTWATMTWVDVTSIVNAVDSSSRNSLINNMFSWSLLDSFGGNVGLVGSVVGNSIGKPIIIETKTSCLAWFNAGNNTSWPYWIDPDWEWWNFEPRQLYCDMTTNWGWRTMVVWIDAANKNHWNATDVTPDNLNNLNWKGKVNDLYINAIQNNWNHQLRLQSTSRECPYYNDTWDTFTNCNFHSDQQSANWWAGCSLWNQGWWGSSSYGLNESWANARWVLYLNNSPSRNWLHEVRVSNQYRSKPWILWAR